MMTLIDADALIEIMCERKRPENGEDSTKARFRYMQWLTDYHAINDAPTVDRPQGEWIEDARTYYETLNERGYFVDQHTPYFSDDIACPNCLAKFSVIDNETERFDYCPNCGARMKGADDEE